MVSDISSSIAKLSVAMNMEKVKTEASVCLLDRVMTDSADLALDVFDMLPPVSPHEIGGLLDARA